MTTKNFVVKNGLTTGNIILDASSSNITASFVVANLSVPASANLGSNANVTITGGTSGQYLQTDGAGGLSWVTIAPSSSYGDSNVSTYLPTHTGNISGNILTLTGNITAINANLGNLVTANYFTGSGNLLSNIQGSNVTGAVSSATTAGTVTTNAQPNITSTGTLVSLNVTGNISSAANVTAQYLIGNGSQLTGVVSNANYAAYAGNVINAAQPNITSVGTLTSLATGDTTITGNLTVTGSFEIANVSTFTVKDPIIEQGGNTSGSALTSNDGFDRGQILHYYSGSAIDAFMGWDNSNAEFAFGSNVSVASEVVTFNQFGNVRANYFLGNASQLTGTIANANYAAYAGNIINAIQPNITSVGTLTSLDVTGDIISSANVTSGNATITGNLTTGSGTGGSITGANLVSANYFTGTLTTNAQPNITSVGTLTSLNVTGNVTAQYLIGDGGYLSNIQVGAGTSIVNGTSNVAVGLNSNVTVSVGGTSNVLVASTTGVSVAGNLSAANVLTDNLLYANGTPWTFTNYSNANVAAYLPTYTGNITGNIVTLTGNITAINANLGNLVTANYFTGTLTTPVQPNITSVGTLTSLNVTGNITSGNATITGTLTAGAGSGGTISGANLISANYFTGTLTTPVQPNITSVGTLTSLNVTGNVSSAANITAAYFIGDGSQLTGLPASYTNTNVSSYLSTFTGLVSAGNITAAGNVTAAYLIGNASQLTGTIANANYAAYAGNVINASQPNITSVGTLTTLAAGDTTITGNLTVTGNFEIANVSTFKVKDPIIEQGGTTTGAALSSNDGFDRGQLLHYYSGQAIDAFMGWDNSNAEFAFGSNVSVASEQVTFNQFGNVRANYFLGNASQLVGTIANANYAAYAGNVTIAAQPTITSVGTLTSLNVTGNISSAANITASYLIGNGSQLTGLPESYTNTNVSSYLATFTGNVSAANILTDNLLYANGAAWTFGGTPQGSNTHVQFNDNGSFGGNAGLVFNKTTTTLTANNLTVSSTTNLGSIANVTITGGTNGQVLSTDGSGGLSWATVSAGGGSSTAAYASVYVDTFTGDGTTTQFTLSVTPDGKNNTTVNYNGAFQLRGAYSISTNKITFSEAPENGSIIEVTTIAGLVSTTGAYTTRNYTGNGSTTAFSVTNGSTDSSLLVTLNGILQVPTTDYAVSGTTLTFVTAPTNGMKIQIRELTSVTATAVSGLDAAVANVKISGGTSGQALITDGAGNLSFGSAGVPSGKIVALNMFLGF